MEMPGRAYSASNAYRFGFNGKENDNDAKGEGNEQNYGERIYDPRIGMFLSVDPLTKQYPELTPYQFASNSPIAGIDLDGREFEWYMLEKAEEYFFGTTHLKKIGEGFVNRATETVTAPFKGDIPEPIRKLMQPGRLATTDPNVATQFVDNNVRAVDYMSKAVVYGLIKNVSDLTDITKKALGGDEKAVGALAFEVLMFFAPEEKGGGALGKIGKVTGDQGVLLSKVRSAIRGDLASAAEIRVAKAFREEGKDVHFIDSDIGHAAGTGTFDFTVDGVRTEVKRFDGLGRNAVSDVAKAVRQVGNNGEVVIVRPASSKFTLEQYKTSLEKNFKPEIRELK